MITGTHADGVHSISAAFHLTALPGWKVTATSDWDDDDNGMGTCYATMAGGCTLPAAIQTASQAGGDKRMILLPANTYEVGYINGIEVDLVIAGAGIKETVVKKADPLAPVQLMFIPSGRAVRLENLSIQQFGPDAGGVVHVNGGRLEAYQAVFAQNTSSNTGGVMCVDSGGQAHLENVTFEGNRSLMANGKAGVMSVSNPGTKVTMVSSTALDNNAKVGSFAWIESGAAVELINSTITGNLATESAALYVDGGSLLVKSSTIAFNRSSGVLSAGLGLGAAGSSITLMNTIVAANFGADGAHHNCAVQLSNASSLISLGGNLFSNDADGCKELVASRPQELNAKLELDGEAMDHGGFTKTLKIGSTSAAIDGGVGECPSEDQRGLPRRPDACDVGAYERQE